MEGRRATDVILATCSASLIVSGGMAKDIGLKAMQDWGIPPFWMPAFVGLIFTPILAFGVLMIHQIPDPTAQEVKSRAPRRAMGEKERMAFVIEIWPGLLCILLAFFLTSSYRDYRDMFSTFLYSLTF
jgi:hypothetical protein